MELRWIVKATSGVADSLNYRVDEFDEAGAFISAFGYGVHSGEAKFEVCTSSCRAGVNGAGSGQFSGPAGLAVDGKGNLWITDLGDARVNEFNAKEEFVAAFGYGVSSGEEKLQVCTASCKKGNSGTGNGQFAWPYGVAVDTKGDIWVADSIDDRVQEFNEAKEYIGQFGSRGSGAGQFQDEQGHGQYVEIGGLALDGKGDVWVADSGNNRVEEWSHSTWLPTKTEGTAMDSTSERLRTDRSWSKET